jgi:hypothetical protein
MYGTGSSSPTRPPQLPPATGHVPSACPKRIALGRLRRYGANDCLHQDKSIPLSAVQHRAVSHGSICASRATAIGAKRSAGAALRSRVTAAGVSSASRCRGMPSRGKRVAGGRRGADWRLRPPLGREPVGRRRRRWPRRHSLANRPSGARRGEALCWRSHRRSAPCPPQGGVSVRLPSAIPVEAEAYTGGAPSRRRRSSYRIR